MDKIYAAIDLKSFYASVECVERGLDPLTTNLVVADKSRTEKTICLAVSPSLKKYSLTNNLGGAAQLVCASALRFLEYRIFRLVSMCRLYVFRSAFLAVLPLKTAYSTKNTRNLRNFWAAHGYFRQIFPALYSNLTLL